MHINDAHVGMGVHVHRPRNVSASVVAINKDAKTLTVHADDIDEPKTFEVHLDDIGDAIGVDGTEYS